MRSATSIVSSQKNASSGTRRRPRVRASSRRRKPLARSIPSTSATCSGSLAAVSLRM